MSKYDSAWTLEEALALCKKLEPHLKKVGAHVGLIGSVLTKGKSKKDLDICIYARNTSDSPSLYRVHTMMKQVGGFKGWMSKRAVRDAWKRAGSTDEKTVELWLYNERRVDVFFFGFPWCW